MAWGVSVIGAGSLVKLFRRCAGLFDPLPDRSIHEFRRAPIRHADETGWRTDGKNGCLWLFATPDMVSSSKDPLSSVLVVNKTPCQIQYCYAHLLREVEDLKKEFTDETETYSLLAALRPKLALVMELPTQRISDDSSRVLLV